MPGHQVSVTPATHSEAEEYHMGFLSRIGRWLLSRIVRSPRSSQVEWRFEGFMGSVPPEEEKSEAEVAEEPNWESAIKILLAVAYRHLGDSAQRRLHEDLKDYGVSALSKAGEEGVEPAKARMLLKTGNVLLSLSKLVGADFQALFRADLLNPSDIPDDTGR